jgi:hypothetical protein
MGDFTGHFIGYGQLEDWAKVISIQEPVYATLVTDAEASSHGIRFERAIVPVAQPQGEIVHYARIPVTAIHWIADTVLTQDHEQRILQAGKAMQITKAWLQERGFIVPDAKVAVPRDCRLLKSNAGCLGYNKESGYFLKEATA